MNTQNNSLWDSLVTAVKASSLTILGNLSFAIINFLYILIVARTLGAEAFGVFSITTLTTVTLSTIGAGAGDILVREVANDKSTFKINFGHTIFIFLTLLIPTLLLTLTILQFLGSSKGLVLAVLCYASGAYFGNYLTEIALRSYQAHERMRGYAIANNLLSISRLLAALGMLLFPSAQAELTWPAFFAVFSLLAGSINMLLVVRSFGKPEPVWKIRHFGHLASFSLMRLMRQLNAVFDRYFLLSVMSFKAFGIYSLSVRLVDYANLPVFSFLSTIYARFFKMGKQGVHSGLENLKSQLPIILVGGVVSWVGLMIIANLTPLVFGVAYQQSTGIIQMMSLVPLVLSLRFLIGDSLSGLGFQRERSISDTVGVAASIGTAVLLIPRFEFIGAVVTVYLTNLVVIICYCMFLYQQYRKAAI